MAEYREYISALRQCAKEHENDKLFTGQISVPDLCNDTAKLLENDVIERSKIDKAIEEIEKQTPEYYGYENQKATQFFLEKQSVIEIIKRNIGE